MVSFNIFLLLGVGSTILLIIIASFFFFKKIKKWKRPSRCKDELVPTEVNSSQTPTDVDQPSLVFENDKKFFFEAFSLTRNIFAGAFTDNSRVEFDDQIRENLETVLLSADIGVSTTDWILSEMDNKLKIEKNFSLEKSKATLRAILEEIAASVGKPLVFSEQRRPFVILVIGVNGVGKTTTIGKLAHRLTNEGKRVMLAAGDTFRAAAVEQLIHWASLTGADITFQSSGTDSASVIFDSVNSAIAKKCDVVIADTAGRLQTKTHLMSELSKIKRVLGKLEIDAPHEILLVLDSTTGQNAISQTREFVNTLKPTGLVMTKLDGTAKGGVLFSLAKQFELPIRYIGLGENANDLKVFDSKDFVNAILPSSVV